MPGPLEVTDPAGDKTDWSAAERFMLEGSDETPTGDRDPEAAKGPREFKYRGKVVKADPETYAILEGLRREARGANGRLGSELAQARERLARLEGAVSTRQTDDRRPEDDIKPPDPLLATKDIVAWQAQYEAHHTAKMNKLARDLEAKYLGSVREVNDRVQTAQRDEAWANKFYAAYDYLDHPDIKPIVGQVYTEHVDELRALADDPESAYERLAELADARLFRIKQAGKAVDNNEPTKRRPPRIESSAGPTPRGKTEDAPREFSAASWVARQRLKMNGREPKK